MQVWRGVDKRLFVLTGAGRLADDGAVATTETQERSAEQVHRDAKLDPELRFAAPPARDPDAALRVLLTGATGFLGAHLLVDLVARGADVCCLVRASDDAGAQQRIVANLDRLGLSLVGLPGRAWGLAGDLAQPGLGLSDARASQLADTLDVIYNAASEVHFVKPYAELRGSNVLGVHELLRLAAARRTKPLHHVSTLALFFRRGDPAPQPPRPISETDWPDLDERNGTGYLHSKWAAEQLIRSAQQRGLPATIYRTGRISGHSHTGITGNPHDLLNLIIAASICLGQYPDWNMFINMAPINYVCKAIIELSKFTNKTEGSIHLFNPKPIAFSHLMGLVSEAGYPLHPVAGSDFQQAVSNAALSGGSQRALFARLALLLKSPHHLFSPRPDYRTPNSQPWLTERGVICPDIDRVLIIKYLAYFCRCGLLPVEPARSDG